MLGELEITARLMITGGEDKEEARMTRADRSLIRQCILDAAQHCVAEAHGADAARCARRAARARPRRHAAGDAARTAAGDGRRHGYVLPGRGRRDVRPVRHAVARGGHHHRGPGHLRARGLQRQLSIAYISLINTVNNIAERDQFLGRPIINVTDEGHIITKNPLLAPYVVKITKMWRKLGAWFWLATQNLDDLPKAAEPMLNMIEWWICLSMPPDEVERSRAFANSTRRRRR